ncbi:hypothetical protein B566_EDAN016825 [Ephemera danica]|nr:hypothetical protein B566_EDAN016825 [Ephemera danica]
MPKDYVEPEALIQKSFMNSKFNIHGYASDDDEEDFFDMKFLSCMRFEYKRLESFKTRKTVWKYPISMEDAAKYGFYYMGGRDTVRCHFCGLMISGWQKFDFVFLEHLKYSRDCSLVRRLASKKNITIADSKKYVESNICTQDMENDLDCLIASQADLPFLNQDGQDLSGLSPKSCKMLDDIHREHAKLLHADILNDSSESCGKDVADSESSDSSGEDVVDSEKNPCKKLKLS